jgi:hypothetical protein
MTLHGLLRLALSSHAAVALSTWHKQSCRIVPLGDKSYELMVNAQATAAVCRRTGVGGLHSELFVHRITQSLPEKS